VQLTLALSAADDPDRIIAAAVDALFVARTSFPPPPPPPPPLAAADGETAGAAAECVLSESPSDTADSIAAVAPGDAPRPPHAAGDAEAVVASALTGGAGTDDESAGLRAFPSEGDSIGSEGARSMEPAAAASALAPQETAAAAAAASASSAGATRGASSACDAPASVAVEPVDDGKPPQLLWCVSWVQRTLAPAADATARLGFGDDSNVFSCAPLGVEPDYAGAIQRAMEIFHRLCPGEDFLPAAIQPGSEIDEALTQLEQSQAQASATDQGLDPVNEAAVAVGGEDPLAAADLGESAGQASTTPVGSLTDH
jgi:hypothetical protein